MFLWLLGQVNSNIDDVVIKGKNNLNTAYNIGPWKYIPNTVNVCNLKLGNYNIVLKHWN